MQCLRCKKKMDYIMTGKINDNGFFPMKVDLELFSCDDCGYTELREKQSYMEYKN